MHAALEEFEHTEYFFFARASIFFCRGLRTYWRTVAAAAAVLQRRKDGSPGHAISVHGTPVFSPLGAPLHIPAYENVCPTCL